MHDRLWRRGWTAEELDHLYRHHPPRKERSYIVMFAILLVVVATLVVPGVYGFLARALPEFLLLLILAVLGLPLGAMLGILLVDLERLDHRHHTLLLLLLPLLLVLEGWVILDSAATGGLFEHNALIGALVYAIAFLIPYAVLVKQEWTFLRGHGSS